MISPICPWEESHPIMPICVLGMKKWQKHSTLNYWRRWRSTTYGKTNQEKTKRANLLEHNKSNKWQWITITQKVSSKKKTSRNQLTFKISLTKSIKLGRKWNYSNRKIQWVKSINPISIIRFIWRCKCC